jgi:hypothetical protein
MRYKVNPDGTVESAAKPDQQETSPTWLIKRASTSTKPTVKCPICHVPVKAGKLPRHLLKIHGIESTTPEEKPPSLVSGPDKKLFGKPVQTIGKVDREMVPCPICQVLVRSDRLERHWRKVHEELQPSPALRPVLTSKVNQKIVRPVSEASQVPSTLETAVQQKSTEDLIKSSTTSGLLDPILKREEVLQRKKQRGLKVSSQT